MTRSVIRQGIYLSLSCLLACYDAKDPPRNESQTTTVGPTSESSASLTSGASNTLDTTAETSPSGSGVTSTADEGTDGTSAATTSLATTSESSSTTGPTAPACAVGPFDAGADALWQRNDIAVCPNDDDTVLPASEGQAEALCNAAAGWRLCTVSDARDRNDACIPGFGFVGLVGTGGNDCVLIDTADPADPRFKCNDDFAREGFTGSCGGATSATQWGFHERTATGGAVHGALCCLD